MTINTRELIEAVSVVADDHNIRVTIQSSIKASAIVAGTTFVGAFVMGPIGIIAGAAVGSFASYSMSKGTFKSAAVVIRDELSDEQKDRLCGHVTEAFKNFGPTDIALLIPLLTTNVSFQKIVIGHIVQFFTEELRMQIID